MKKETFQLCVRFLIGLAVSLVLVGAVGSLEDKLPQPQKADLFQSASGIRSTAVALTVDGESVYADEYLYYVATYGSQYASMLGGSVDWDMDMGGGITLGESILGTSENNVIQNAIIRKLAADNGVVIAAEDQAGFDSALEQARATYGADGLANALAAQGMTERVYTTYYRTSTLYYNLIDAFAAKLQADGDAALQEKLDEHGMVEVYSLMMNPESTEDADVAARRAQFDEFRARIAAAADPAAEFRAIKSELGVSNESNTSTFYHSHEESTDTLSIALKTLEVNELSEVLEMDGYFCLLLRVETDLEQAAAEIAAEEVYDLTESAIENADIQRDEALLGQLDLGSFLAVYMAVIQG